MPITPYPVIGERIVISGSNTTVVSTTTVDIVASARSCVMTLPTSGRVRFRIIAVNAVGVSAASANSSGTITAR